MLLVHSPLLGPSSLRRLAAHATAVGIDVVLPDLTAMTAAAQPHLAYTGRAIDAGRGLAVPVAVIGHSGAGPFLPTIRDALGPQAVAVFVDAVVPPRTGQHRTRDGLRDLLDQQTRDGTLRPWLDWWPPEVIEQVLPDPADAAALRADMPMVPRSFYDHDVGVPIGWSERACGFVQLSTAYDADHDGAVDRGWPTEQVISTHLAVHTRPAEVFGAIQRVLVQLGHPR